MFSPRKKKDAESEHGYSSGARYVSSFAAELLHEDKGRQGGHPGEIHYSDGEQDAHQSPAAAEAVHTMPESHQKCTPRTVAPVGQQETERALALPQTCTLRRGQLIQTRSDQNCAGEARTQRGHA